MPGNRYTVPMVLHCHGIQRQSALERVEQKGQGLAFDSLGIHRQTVENKWRAGLGGCRSRGVEKRVLLRSVMGRRRESVLAKVMENSFMCD